MLSAAPWLARLTSTAQSQALRVVAALSAQASLAAVFAVLTARWMGPDDRGVVVLLTTTVSLLTLVGSLGAATGGRFLLSKEATNYSLKRHGEVAARLSAIHVLTFVALGLPILTLSGGWRGARIATIVVCYGVVMLAIYFLREGVHGLGRHGWATLGDVLLNVSLVTGVLLVHAYSHLTITTVAVLLLVAALVELTYMCLLVSVQARRNHPFSTPLRLVSLVILSAPALAGVLTQALVIRGDRLVLGGLVDSRAVGIYGTAATFTETIWLIPMGVGQLLFRLSARNAFHKIRRLQIAAILCVISLAVGVAVLAEPIVNLLLGDAYSRSVPLVWLLLAASIPMAVYHLQAPVLNGAGDFKGTAIAAAISVAVLLTLCVSLIPRWNEYGAGVASFAAYSCMASITTYRVHQLRSKLSRQERIVQGEEGI